MDAIGFISSLIVYFPIKHEDAIKERAWTQGLVHQLRHFDSATLTKASENIIGTRKGHEKRFFPQPAECIEACAEAKRWVDADKGRVPTRAPLHLAGQPRHDEWSVERVKLADDLIVCALGREAAKDGWIGTLHDFIRNQSRLPSGGEIAACKRQAKETDAAYAQCVKGGWGQAAEFQDMGAKLLRKREALAAVAMGGA